MTGHFIRFWCTTCYQVTTHREEGGADGPGGKLECQRHTRGREVDWVKVAIEAASEMAAQG